MASSPVLTTPLRASQLDEIERQARYALAKQSFAAFLDFVYILERPRRGVIGGKSLFQKWPHLMRLVADLEKHRLIDVIKARQEGFSWIMAAYATWHLRFKPGSLVLMLSRGQNESRALLKKSKYIYRNLPPEWIAGDAIDSDSGVEFSLKGNDSQIIALPSTQDAGRSETASVVIQDEADFHEYLNDNYLAVKPTIDAGGTHIMGSTVNKRNESSLFTNLYQSAPGNGWHPVFWSCFEVPGRDEEWYEEKRREAEDLPDAQSMGVALYMEQEYPRTIEEALAPSRALSPFDGEVLKEMSEDVKRPIHRVGYRNVYQGFRLGRKYSCATDVSHGKGLDYSVTVVFDVNSNMVVADIMSNVLDPEAFTEESINLLREYRDPIWIIEDNDQGELVIKLAQRAGYTRFFTRTTGRNHTYEHWHTDEVSRRPLFGELILAVNKRQISIPSRAGLAQFYSVIMNPEKRGRIEAKGGGHDDYPLAVALALQATGQAFMTAPAGSAKRPRWF